jgi:hypothetical protein
MGNCRKAAIFVFMKGVALRSLTPETSPRRGLVFARGIEAVSV